jgi:hypothetical protein
VIFRTRTVSSCRGFLATRRVQSTWSSCDGKRDSAAPFVRQLECLGAKRWAVWSACRHQTSVTTGTILEKTRTPLTTWFEAAWHLTTTKNGLSAKTLERTLGTSYRTAWAMLQRFRVAMVRSERERLRLTRPWWVESSEEKSAGVEPASQS